MNTAVTTTNKFRALNAAPAHSIEKPKLIIISDATERLSNLQSAISKTDSAITTVNLLTTSKAACWCNHDVAIVDVGPDALLRVLQQLRASEGCEAISILVDVTRLTAEPALAGVLSAYRAMPCGGYELLRLARRRLFTLESEERFAGALL